MRTSLPLKYAQSLFSKTEVESEGVFLQLQTLCSVLEKQMSIDIFFSYPKISLQKKRDFLQNIFDKIAIHPRLRALCFLLLRKNLFFLRQSILDEYCLLLENKNKVLRAVLELSSKENEDTLKRVQLFFEERFSQKILWNVVKKTSIIAGFSVLIDGKCYNSGLSNQLQKMKTIFVL